MQWLMSCTNQNLTIADAKVVDRRCLGNIFSAWGCPAAPTMKSCTLWDESQWYLRCLEFYDNVNYVYRLCTIRPLSPIETFVDGRSSLDYKRGPFSKSSKTELKVWILIRRDHWEENTTGFVTCACAHVCLALDNCYTLYYILFEIMQCIVVI